MFAILLPRKIEQFDHPFTPQKVSVFQQILLIMEPSQMNRAFGTGKIVRRLWDVQRKEQSQQNHVENENKRRVSAGDIVSSDFVRGSSAFQILCSTNAVGQFSGNLY